MRSFILVSAMLLCYSINPSVSFSEKNAGLLISMLLVGLVMDFIEFVSNVIKNINGNKN
jgi:hypothetical protein